MCEDTSSSYLILMLVNLRNMKQVYIHTSSIISNSTRFVEFLQKLQPNIVLHSIQNFLPQSHKLVNLTSTKKEV